LHSFSDLQPDGTPFHGANAGSNPAGDAKPDIIAVIKPRGRKSCMIDVFCEFKKPIECDHTKPSGKNISQSSRR